MKTVPGKTDRVVIVGAGLAGLSAALRLTGAGREVTVLEREPVPGGRNGLLEVRSPTGDGTYRFDTGPTVLTMPDLIADALDCVGERLARCEAGVERLEREDPAQPRVAEVAAHRRGEPAEPSQHHEPRHGRGEQVARRVEVAGDEAGHLQVI